MNRTRIFPVLLLLLLIPAYFSVQATATRLHKTLPVGAETNIVLPSPLLKITSLEFDGIASDMLYLKALVFYGSTYVKNKQTKISDERYSWFYDVLKASSDLDPYFLDPYFLGNSVLSWEADRPLDAIELMKKGSQKRDWDYWLPFYIGFNYFYFLKDSVNASKYLMIASNKPGADPFFAFFAARLAYEGKQTENAIIFLEGILKSTKDETTRKNYELRLDALKIMLDLEKALEAYKMRFGGYPLTLSVLVEQHIVARIPSDPYGGEFYIDKGGTVKTTSGLRPMKKEADN